MNSRERVLAAMNHTEPDRVAVDFGSHRSSGIMAIAYAKLRDHLGLPRRPIRVYDFIQQLAIIDDDVLEVLGTDAIDYGRGFMLADSDWAEWELSDGTPCLIPAFIRPVKKDGDWLVYGDDGQVIAIQKAGCLYFEQTCFPLADRPGDLSRLTHDLDQIMWWRLGTPPAPLGLDTEGLAARAAGAKALRASSDRAIVAAFGGNFLEIGEFLYRIDNFLYELAANPLQAHNLLDAVLGIYLENLEKFLGAVGPYIDIILFADDLGMQTGPQISPRMYREFFKPRHKILWNRAKELCPHIKVKLHCCGGVYPILGDLIDAGLDAINPVQTSCNGMDPARLKAEFGRDLVFWGGGCDTRDVLPNGTPEDVRRDVRESVAILAPGGGFVFQQVHNIMADVPPENIVAMFEALRD
jgi:uroporphyrinogen decarboxylase